MARLLADGRVSRLDHAAYLGAELCRAELALRLGRSFEQDGPF
jgi:dihydropteroate synthase